MFRIVIVCLLQDSEHLLIIAYRYFDHCRNENVEPCNPKLLAIRPKGAATSRLNTPNSPTKIWEQQKCEHFFHVIYLTNAKIRLKIVFFFHFVNKKIVAHYKILTWVNFWPHFLAQIYIIIWTKVLPSHTAPAICIPCRLSSVMAWAKYSKYSPYPYNYYVHWTVIVSIVSHY